MNKIVTLLAVSVLNVTNGFAADDARINRVIDSTLNSRGKTNFVVADNDERSLVLAGIRELARAPESAKGRSALVTLANLGDRSSIKDIATKYRTMSPNRMVILQREIEKHCKQPLLISEFGEDAFIEEEPKHELLNHEFLVEPRSVRASRIIRSVIVNSSEFPDPARRWAASLVGAKAEELRGKVRQWLTENRTVLEAHQFDKATGLSEGESANQE